MRAAFPRYQCQVEKLPGVNGAPARTVNNHTFISEDGGYKLSLTKDFIALSTMRYTHWGLCRPSRRAARPVYQDLPSQLL